MAHALNDDGARARYLALEVDTKIPTWIFAQRQFPLPNPLPSEDTVTTTTPDPTTSATRSVTVTKLTAAILQEASLDVGKGGATTGDESFVSLWNIDATQKGTVVSAGQLAGRPASSLSAQGVSVASGLSSERATLRAVRYAAGRSVLPRPTRTTLLACCRSGRRRIRSDVAAMSLILETKAGSRIPVAEWTIARTNLTRAARSSRASALMAMPQPLPLPYVAVSGGGAASSTRTRFACFRWRASPTQAARLFSLRAGTSATDVPSREASDDPPLSRSFSAWCSGQCRVPTRPEARGFPSLRTRWPSWALSPPTPCASTGSSTLRSPPVRHQESSPSGGRAHRAPPRRRRTRTSSGTAPSAWWNTPAESAAGEILQRGDTAVALSPAPELPGDPFLSARPTTMSTVSSGLHNLHTGDTAAMRLLAPHHVAARAAATRTAAGDSVTRFYRATLACYDGETSPYARMGDPRRRLITFLPAFRDVFGNRFAAASAPAVSRRLFYTDALINPAEWPGISFGLYSTSRGGKPCLALEASYRYLDPKDDKRPRLKRLGEIRDQLRGVDGDVATRLVAAPSSPESCRAR